MASMRLRFSTILYIFRLIGIFPYGLKIERTAGSSSKIEIHKASMPWKIYSCFLFCISFLQLVSLGGENEFTKLFATFEVPQTAIMMMGFLVTLFDFGNFFVFVHYMIHVRTSKKIFKSMISLLACAHEKYNIWPKILALDFISYSTLLMYFVAGPSTKDIVSLFKQAHVVFIISPIVLNIHVFTRFFCDLVICHLEITCYSLVSYREHSKDDIYMKMKSIVRLRKLIRLYEKNFALFNGTALGFSALSLVILLSTISVIFISPSKSLPFFIPWAFQSLMPMMLIKTSEMLQNQVKLS